MVVFDAAGEDQDRIDDGPDDDAEGLEIPDLGDCHQGWLTGRISGLNWVASTSRRANTSAVRAPTPATATPVHNKLDEAVGEIASNFTPKSAILNECLIEMS
jgi:hypothetical protein